jgi:lipopolysaccharide biosynthesis glycosyltransferase
MPDSAAIVFLAADEAFSRPLAVTVRSIVAHLTPGRELELHLCDMGTTARSRGLIEQVAEHPGVSLRWITNLQEKVADLPQSWHHISAATYARLFIPALLPETAAKALYLDCDIIVRRCVGELFDTPVDDWAAMAVANAGAPYVSSPLGLPYWWRHGRRADEVNYNAGVLMMNLTAWRAGDVTGAALEYLDKEHLFQGDQAAINAVLPGRIGGLDPRWNQQTGLFSQAFEAALPYTAEQVEQLRADPWIVHYTTDIKPWHYQSTHPFRAEWFARLDETPFRGWRPSRASYYGGLSKRAVRDAKKRLLPSTAPAGRR